MRSALRHIRVAVLLLAATVPSARAESDGAAAWGEAVSRAIRQGGKVPLVSSKISRADIDFAYAVQRDAVARLVSGDSDPIVGYKAGLTSEAAQARFGVDQPLSGVLLASMDYSAAADIKRGDFHRLMIETEIAFVVGKAIRRPLKSKRALRRRLRSAIAVIEMPDLAFEDMEALRGVDIAAANVGAAIFLKGEDGERGALRELSTLRVTLERDGMLVNEGIGSDAAGDPLGAALWLVNASVGQGYKVEPGQILLSGSLGEMIPALPGAYRADFGPLGVIIFSVR